LVAAGRILDQVEWMEQLLTDPSRSELVLVTLLEELPVLETVETIDWVRDEGLVGRLTVIANRVLPPLDAEIPAGNGPLVEAASLHHELWSEQQAWAARLDTDRSLPYLFGTHTPTEVAEQLADILEDGV
jgi:hypothetical protein